MWLVSLALEDLVILLTIRSYDRRRVICIIHQPAMGSEGLRNETEEPEGAPVRLQGHWRGRRRWSLLIIRETIAGTTRFSALHRRLGVAKNILNLRLRASSRTDFWKLRRHPTEVHSRNTHCQQGARVVTGARRVGTMGRRVLFDPVNLNWSR